MDSEDRERKAAEESRIAAKTGKIRSNITPIKITGSKAVRSLNKFMPSVNPYGYYKKFLRLGHIFKSPKPKTPLEYMPGLYQYESKINSKDTIKESISETLKRKASRHVNEYMKSEDGAKLKNKVNSIIQGKLREKKKV